LVGVTGHQLITAHISREYVVLRVLSIRHQHVEETDCFPESLIQDGFVWMSFARREFEVLLPQIQANLEKLCGVQLVDLHVHDLLNNQLPSHYDFTSDYHLMVFRRLAAGQNETDLSRPGAILHRSRDKGGPPVLHRIDTSPVAFVVFDRLVLTVHPADCSVRESFATRLLSGAVNAGTQSSLQRLPSSSADLMLRVIGQMVDGYLNLRRELTKQLDHWQTELINPNTRFNNWHALLDARLSLHQLDEICEDQRAAIQDWIDALALLDSKDMPGRTLELLRVRSRDVLEHIERVVHHVRRLEQSAETAVQMHFNAQSNRTNDIMRTLTVLTAIFLPLNLITGFFGMNFENFPFIHDDSGLWLTELSMLLLGVGLVVVFWRKKYLGEH
jgi:magnesium transporter